MARTCILHEHKKSAILADFWYTIPYMELNKTYDLIAEDWHAQHQNDDWWAGGTDVFTSLVKPGGLVLDVGCGGGMKSRYLIKKGLRVVGIDFSKKMIEIAKREVPEGEFHVLDLHKVGSLGYRFDGIFMQAVLLHIPRSEAVAVLRSMASLLNDGGHLYVAVKDKKEGRPDEGVKQEDDYGYPYKRFFSYFSLDELRDHFAHAGLAIVFEKVAPVGNTRWIEMIGKRI